MSWKADKEEKTYNEHNANYDILSESGQIAPQDKGCTRITVSKANQT